MEVMGCLDTARGRAPATPFTIRGVEGKRYFVFRHRFLKSGKGGWRNEFSNEPHKVTHLLFSCLFSDGNGRPLVDPLDDDGSPLPDPLAVGERAWTVRDPRRH